MSTEHEWLANLRVGDKVVRSYGYGIRTLSLDKVTHVTPKQVHIRGEKFYRADGAKIGRGGDWAKTEILMPTKERLDTIRRGRIVSNLSQVAWSALPLDTLEAVLALVSPPLPEKP